MRYKLYLQTLFLLSRRPQITHSTRTFSVFELFEEIIHFLAEYISKINPKKDRAYIHRIETKIGKFGWKSML